jgi:hypothetical protein
MYFFEIYLYKKLNKYCYVNAMLLIYNLTTKFKVERIT